ncbi:MAG: hypothetical protein H8E44_30185 [Planctomycetes bacterium]|nr:hypothetical protein [Planctomycetota bacterium]MBL7041085.1 hypothetical protein [Pirellulaceae bacterium]
MTNKDPDSLANELRLSRNLQLDHSSTSPEETPSYVCVQAAVWGRLEEEWVSQDPVSKGNIEKLRSRLNGSDE